VFEKEKGPDPASQPFGNIGYPVARKATKMRGGMQMGSPPRISLFPVKNSDTIGKKKKEVVKRGDRLSLSNSVVKDLLIPKRKVW